MYPDMSFAGYSSFLERAEDSPPGTIAEEYRNKLGKVYDFLLPDICTSIWEIMDIKGMKK